jgi:hypothetical protein
MTCELIEKVSLLLDGELPPAEMHEIERHLLTCAECQEARLDFTNLRQQITAYPLLVDVVAQRRALAAILDAQGRTTTTHAPGWGERLRAAFAAPRFSPAWAAALALVLVACAVGFFVYHNSQRNTSIANTPPNKNTQAVAPVVAPTTNTNTRNELANAARNEQDNKPQPTPSTRAQDKQVVARGSVNKQPRTRVHMETANATPPRATPQPAPQIKQETAPAYVNTNAAAADLAHAPADTGTLTARHVEQSELLLRAFRNAREGEQDAASDLVYERRRAQQLLYANIVLRREAAAAGNVQVATLLDSLEPILLDIANLPEHPQGEDVRAIKERVERKNLVALLQVNSAALARAYD